MSKADSAEPAINAPGFRDFTRIAWVSDNARAVWEPRFERIRAAWLEIEWRSVAEGIRECAVLRLSPDAMVDRAADLAEAGLVMLPFAVDAASHEPYRNIAPKPAPGGAIRMRSVVGRLDSVLRFKKCIDDADDTGIGALLGYPSCCTNFFRHVWLEAGLRDTTWSMAAHGGRTDGKAVEVEGYDVANILWRWVGIRAVPHLPCSFDCKETARLADSLLKVGERFGARIEVGWLREILAWPVAWSALHGIAEIKTPILRISAGTDRTGEIRNVRRRGRSYPVEGARGLTYPYQQPPRPKLTGSKAFLRGLREIETASPPAAAPPWYATDNGFRDAAAMAAAHEPIIHLATQALENTDGGSIIDLGCGNGALLKGICAGHPNMTPFGIEKDSEKLAHVRALFAVHADNFLLADLFDDDWKRSLGSRFQLGLLMPGRMLETTEARARSLLSWLRINCDEILLYCYQDWDDGMNSLESLAGRAGFRLKAVASHQNAALAWALGR